MYRLPGLGASGLQALHVVLGLAEQASGRVRLHRLREDPGRQGRLCWQQARYQSRLAGGLPRGAVSVLEDGGRLPWHQLFFDRMQLRRPEGPVHQHGRRGAPVKPPPAPAGRPALRWVQPWLFEAWRDFTRFDEDADADLGNPWVAWASTWPGSAARPAAGGGACGSPSAGP
ncbi:MAG: hypothetical protein ABSB76_02455 [Streptosporangiaceae bacterium]